MPLYEFHCPTCDHQFAELVPLGTLAPCPNCGEKKVNRRLSKFFIARKPPIPAVAALERPGERTGFRAGSSPPEPRGATHGGRLVNCTSVGGEVGVMIGPGARVVSEGLRVEKAKVGIHNEGILEDSGTIIR